MKENNAPKTILRSDYLPPEFWVDTVHLHFVLNPEKAGEEKTGAETTRVENTMSLRRNSARGDKQPLLLDGSHATLVSVALNGEKLAAHHYQLDDHSLQIDDLPDSFELTVVTDLEPQNNTALEGLYKSSGNYCTQCEAQGFRRITYYPDRPDVMARFTVTIDADKTKYPVLLSNGNPVAHGELAGGRHFVKWDDPHPKPSYLFALVAGDLACISDTFTTASGRSVALQIYVEKHNADKCDHALRSLKKAMQWDEEVFGLEYDLDLYMIVAVDDFNMGAMENKGLNVFNSKFVLANQATATDADFQHIEAVIAHEYFHNWTGNRVTCRDWFQLSLKEGLTVFRDQEFSSDMNSRTVKRIADVRLLRARQFPEDAGPTAHPIRPDSYLEINNFYTLTVYEKGAEVIRMIHTLLGAKKFRKGMDLYFARHDGQAVTCDDFVRAMADASSVDLGIFKRWYAQAGTPELRVTMDFDAAEKTCTLNFSQSTPTQSDNLPLHIPIKLGLLDERGFDLALGDGHAACLDLCHAEQSFTFKHINTKPTPSLLRGFSAPVKLVYDYSDEQLAFLLAHDSDAFNRWEAGQQLSLRLALQLVAAIQNSAEKQVPRQFLQAFKSLLANRSDDALLAQALQLPGEETIGEELPTMDMQLLHQARKFLLTELANFLQKELLTIYWDCAAESVFKIDAESIGKRNLKNTCLAFLSLCADNSGLELAKRQFESARNMTDEIAALGIICNAQSSLRDTCLQQFYTKWQDERLVIDKWFSLQAMSTHPDALSHVRALTAHVDFDLQNPNRVRSLLSAFSVGNPVRFHAEDGAAYQLLTDFILQLDKTNPQIAARMIAPMARWKRYPEPNQEKMKAQLQRIVETENLSNDVFELAEKSLIG